MATSWALWTLARLLLVPAAALVLVACCWRPTPPPASSEQAEVPAMPSTVAALRQLARARGLTTAGGRRVSQARKADLLEALAAA
jgi:hypothetical protein